MTFVLFGSCGLECNTQYCHSCPECLQQIPGFEIRTTMTLQELDDAIGLMFREEGNSDTKMVNSFFPKGRAAQYLSTKEIIAELNSRKISFQQN